MLYPIDNDDDNYDNNKNVGSQFTRDTIKTFIWFRICRFIRDKSLILEPQTR